MKKPSWGDAPKLCSINDCNSKIAALGFCDKHYRRNKKHGSPYITKHEMHGERLSLEYKVWCHIKERCLNKASKHYKDYGGRGITVCQQWENSFLCFLVDMGRKPSSKHQIDRKDNNKGYNADNCRWVLSCENNQNRRSTKLSIANVIAIRKSSKERKELAKEFSVSISQIYRVINKKRWANI